MFRQKAGAAVGTAEAVAFTAPDGTSIATFSLDYDYINLEGRVSARDLVISDSTNLVPDEQLQTAEIWIDSAEWVMVSPNGLASSRSLGELRYIGTSSTGSAVSTGKTFAVVAGDKLACSFQLKSQDGSFRAYAQLQFFDRLGTSLSLFSFGITVSSSTGFINVAPADHHCPGRRRLGRLALGGRPHQHDLVDGAVHGAAGPAAEPDRRDRRRRDHRREGELLRPRRGGGDARLLHDHLGR